jgi:hypothetical protein
MKRLQEKSEGRILKGLSWPAPMGDGEAAPELEAWNSSNAELILGLQGPC